MSLQTKQNITAYIIIVPPGTVLALVRQDSYRKEKRRPVSRRYKKRQTALEVCMFSFGLGGVLSAAAGVNGLISIGLGIFGLFIACGISYIFGRLSGAMD